MSVFIQQRTNQIRINIERRPLELGKCGREIDQVEPAGSTQNAKCANEGQLAARRFLSRSHLI